MNTLCKILVFSLLIIFTLSVSAAHSLGNDTIKFDHLSIEDGLSHNRVNNLLQDKRGFMWFGTMSGLNKYDGSEFTVYTHNSKDSNSLSDNYIWYLYEDQSGVLWVGSWGGGLTRFDPVNETFTRYRHNNNDPQSLSNDNVWSIAEDNQNRLWVATENGLNRFDSVSETFVRYLHDPNNPNSLSSNSLTLIHAARNGVLWIGTYGAGLNRFDPVSETVTRYQHEDNNPNSLSNDFIWYVYEDNAGIVWLGTEGGLNRFDPASDTFAHYLHDENDPGSLSHNTVLCMYQDSNNILWVGTYGGGLNRFDPASETFTRYQYDPKNLSSLGNNIIWTIHEDATKTLWFGTDNGVAKYDPGSHRFDHYQHDENDPNSLSDNEVQAIYEDQSGVLWIGTKGGGLNKFDRKHNSAVTYQHDPDNPNSLSNNAVTAIRPAGKEMLWIGTQGGGLNKFDPVSESFLRYQHDPNNPNSLINDAITDIAIDSAGALWIATYGAGLDWFNPASSHFEHYQRNEHIGDWATTVYIDPSGMVWVGFEGYGVTRIDPVHETFTNYRNASHGLSNDTVYAIYADSTGTIWIGTNDGLSKFNSSTETFTPYYQQDGLAGRSVFAIVEDNQKNLWMSTDKGLTKFSPGTDTFRNYDARDGLQSNLFLWHAAYKSERGELFFGGINGFNAFYPDNLSDNPHIPSVVLTDFQLFNRSVSIGADSPLQQHINVVDEMTLSYEQSVFSFKFSALNFRHSDKNQYAYIMEGFDKQWTYVDSRRRFVTYTNLDSGEYTFRVKASNNDGVWNEQGTSVKIIITPPWWETFWFRGSMLALLVGLVFTGFRWRMRAVEARRRQLEIQVAERTKELRESKEEAEAAKEKALEAKKAAEMANQSKSRFLASMSHELRTPLNAVLGFSQLMRKDPTTTQSQRENLDIINRSGAHLLTLIDDILDIAKIEAGHLVLEPENVDLKELIDSVIDMMRNRAETKNLQLSLDQSSDFPRYIHADTAKLRQILVNLIGNAIKYTEQGEVTLKVTKVTKVTKVEEFPSREGIGVGSQSSIPSTESILSKVEGLRTGVNLQFEIEDTGIGIAPKDRERIFQPFEQAEKLGHVKGTGLGLTITHQYVELMEGNISVESEPGKGSIFRFEIPVQRVSSEEIQQAQSTHGSIIGLEPEQPAYRILIVEDQVENRILLRKLLESAGFVVQEAVNGEEAVRAFKEWSPHLIWMDWRMPVMDGLEATRRIKAMPGGPETIIIALTANVFKEQRNEVLEAGCNDFVRKPLKEEEIFEMIAKYLEVRYVYEEEQQVAGVILSGVEGKEHVAEKEVLGPEALAALPSDVLARLEHATFSGDVEQIDRILAEIRAHKPGVADMLTRLANNFEYDEILRLIQEFRDPTSSTLQYKNP